MARRLAGCGLFLLFAWLELVAPGRDVPRNIAIAILIYSALTWAGFAIFGRDTWLKRGEVFSVAFGLFGRFAPLDFTHDGRWRVSLRPFAAGLLTRTPLEPSMTAFILLMLGTVTVDGFMETPLWAAAVECVFASMGALTPIRGCTWRCRLRCWLLARSCWRGFTLPSWP